MYSRILSLLFMIMCIGGGIVSAAQPAPQIEAEAAVLMVSNTREVLFDKKPYDIMYPASTTKIMTLITALEKGDPNSIVTVSPKAATCEGSSLELKAGERLTLHDAMYGMMLVSGNDSAEAIAESVGGSIPSFAKMMTDKAEKIGALQTHFSNPHGLPDPFNHFTTAYDLALITAYGMENKEFANIVSTREYDVNFLNGKKTHVKNTNKFLKSYAGANGVKTGYTDAAGDCLVAAAKRDGVQLIAVILNDDERWDDAAKLLDYGFAQIAQSKIKK
ncbi:D-alanyl-D-alanine carboxypeptidase family protein [Pelosinus sp. sgz500959]|uniref:D-alanyl-D-alanine carboxypeptidase family protein n=1 Tax=Pelosinus sp. sgz500959 TaxID=3242472 RepID=UPI00366B9465